MSSERKCCRVIGGGGVHLYFNKIINKATTLAVSTPTRQNWLFYYFITGVGLQEHPQQAWPFENAGTSVGMQRGQRVEWKMMPVLQSSYAKDLTSMRNSYRCSQNNLRAHFSNCLQKWSVLFQDKPFSTIKSGMHIWLRQNKNRSNFI